MRTLKTVDVKANFREICSQVYEGETIILSRPKNQNIIMLSEIKYNELEKARRNLTYLQRLNESVKQTEKEVFATVTLSDLFDMEN